MEERIIDKDELRGVKRRRTDGEEDVVDELSSDAEQPEEAAQDYTLEFEGDDYDEDLVGLTPSQLKEELERRERLRAEAHAESEKRVAAGDEKFAAGEYAAAAEQFRDALGYEYSAGTEEKLYAAVTENYTNVRPLLERETAEEFSAADEACRARVLEAFGEQLRAERAEAELAGYRAEGRADIESDAEARRRSAYEKKADAGRTLKSEERAIADDYESALGSYGSEMARRGLARSSVAAEGAAAIEKGRADALSSARSARAAADAEADSELRALEADMQKALNAFDIAYAARLTERIAELTSEREEREAEAIKYENRLKEKEYDIMREVTDGDYETVKKGEVPSSLLDIYNEERYEAVNKYLSGLDPEEAESVVRNDPFIRDSVSDYWYYMLYRTYSLDE